MTLAVNYMHCAAFRQRALWRRAVNLYYYKVESLCVSKWICLLSIHPASFTVYTATSESESAWSRDYE